MDAMGFLESLFQLLRARALSAQPEMYPVRRLPSGMGGGSLPLLSCQPSPAPGRTLGLPTHAVTFNPTDPAGMWVGLARVD